MELKTMSLNSPIGFVTLGVVLPTKNLNLEEERRVAKAFVSGEKITHIAKRLELSIDVIRHGLIRQGVYQPRWAPHKFTEDERRQMLDLHSEGFSDTGIARHMDLNRKSIRKYLNKMGMKPNLERLRSRTLNLPTEPAILGYIAGIVDGEGNIFSRLRPKRSLQVVVAVTNTDKSLIDWLMRIGGRVQHNVSKGSVNHFGKKEVYRWIVSRRRDVKPLVEAILPYLIVKRADAIKVFKGLDNLGV